MGNEIQYFDGKQQGGAVAVVTANDFLAMVVAAAKDNSIDAEKMRAMATLAMDMQKHQLEMDKLARQEQFNRDLNAAIDEMPVISKTGRIIIPGKNGEADRVQGTYARFEDLNRIVKPILQRHNLTISFTPGGSDTRVTIGTVIRHANGIVKEYEPLPLPFETSGSKNNVQGVGSSISYGKRYAMCAVLNITVEAEDDDGSGGGRVMPEERVNLVIEEATAHYDDGDYTEWFKTQSPKDRAWLVTNGHHTRFGGSPPALTGPAAGAVPRDNSTPKREDPPAQDAPRIPKQGREWADGYLRDVSAVRTLDSFALLQDEHKDMRERAKAYPTLWREIQDAEGAAMDRLSKEAEKDGGDELFPGGGE